MSLTRIVCSLLLLAAVMISAMGSPAFALKRGEPLEVFESTCPKAWDKFYREAKSNCIRKGKQLRNTYPGKCQENPDATNSLEKIRLEGTFTCGIRS